MDGFETLVAQLTKGLIFAQYAGAPISDIDLVDMHIKNIIGTGLYKEDYKKWYGRTAQQKLCPAFKTLWAKQVRLMKFTTKTVGQMGSGMNTIQEEADKEYDESCQMMTQAHLAQLTAISNMSNNSS